MRNGINSTQDADLAPNGNGDRRSQPRLRVRAGYFPSAYSRPVRHQRAHSQPVGQPPSFSLTTPSRLTMPSLTREQCLAYGSRLKERTILITGAGSGFGRETALAFANLGAKVVLGDVNLTGLAETVQMVHAAHGR